MRTQAGDRPHVLSIAAMHNNPVLIDVITRRNIKTIKQQE